MASKIIITDTDEILQDLQKIAKDMSNKMAEKAKNDLNKAFDDVISNYYSIYEPRYYHRHGVGGLYRALISSKVSNSGVGNLYSRKAIMKVGSMDMPNYNKRVAKYGGHDVRFRTVC